MWEKLCLVLAVLLFSGTAYAQIPTCGAALAAKPQGPFPCSVVAAYVDNSTNEDGFILQRRVNGGIWITLTTTKPNITSIIDATLQQSPTVDNLYEYQVIATNSTGQSTPSNIASFTIPKALVAPAPATGLTITFNGATGVMKLTGGRTVNIKQATGTFTMEAAAIKLVDIH